MRVVLAMLLGGVVAAGAATPRAAAAQEPRRERVEAAAPPLFECVEPPAKGCVVSVVDAKGEPVEGAWVTWFEEAPAHADLLAPEPVLTELRRTFGRTVRTGPDGRARIGVPVRVVASEGARYAGCGWVRPGRPITLTLRPARDVAVQCVDSDGEPLAEVPLMLRAGDWARPESMAWCLSTAADGCARFGPIDLLCAFEDARVRELFVSVEALLAEELLARVDLAAPPAEPVRLVLPPTGRVRIEVIDPEGRPIETAGTTRIAAPWDADEPSPGRRFPATQWHASAGLPAHELRYVEVGLEFELRVDREGWSSGERALVAGPARAGEQVLLRAVLRPRPRLVARVVDAEGRALCGQEVLLVLTPDLTRQQRVPLGRATTDANGRLELEFDGLPVTGRSTEGGRLIEAVTFRPDGFGLARSGFVPLREAAPGDWIDVGTIELGAVPLLASGRVVDDAGSGIAGVALWLVALPAEGMFRGNFTDRVLGATSGAEGRFEFWGDAPVGRLQLRSELSGDARDRYRDNRLMDLVAGASGLELVLPRTGRIVGRIVGDAREMGSITVSGNVAYAGYQSGSSVWVDDDGGFELVVPAGRATIEFALHWNVVATQVDVAVEPGGVVELAPLDLDAVPGKCVMTIVDEAGRPIPEGWFAQVARDTPFFAGFDDGTLVLRSATPLAGPLAVGAAGFLSAVVGEPPASERIVLRRAPQATLEVEFDGAALPDGVSLSVALVPCDDEPEPLRFGPPGSDADLFALPSLEAIPLQRRAPAPLPVRCLGRHSLQLLLEAETPNGSTAIDVAATPREIEILPDRAEQRFRIRIDRTALDAALDELLGESDDD